jgi:hypothetical protein
MQEVLFTHEDEDHRRVCRPSYLYLEFGMGTLNSLPLTKMIHLSQWVFTVVIARRDTKSISSSHCFRLIMASDDKAICSLQ